MSVTCPQCGAFNRDTARFCSMCRAALPAQQSPPAQPVPGPRQALQPLLQPSAPAAYPAPVSPLQPAPIGRQAAMPRRRLFQRGPLLEGRINVVDAERQEKTPFDPARAMVMLAFICLIAGLFLSFAAAGMALGIVLLLLGVGVGLLGCLAGLLLLPVKLVLGPIINFIRGDPTVSVLNFQVLDGRTGAPVDVLLYRKPGSGNVRLGDTVRVHGSMQRSSNVVRARRVQVTESSGHPTDYKIDALKPWPLWIGLLILGSAVVGALQLAGLL